MRRLHGKLWPRLTGLPYPADRKTRPSYLREITRNGQAGAPPRLVTSSTWGPPPPCKQALSLFLREDGLIVRIFNFEQLFNNLLLLNQNKRITFLSRSKETHSLKSLSVINVVFGFFFLLMFGFCHQSLDGHHGAITCVKFDDYHILTGSLDCYAMAWSAVGKHKKCLQAFRHPKYV